MTSPLSDRPLFLSALPAIVDWYVSRSLTPWLAVPDRLLRLPDSIAPHLETLVMVRYLPSGEPNSEVSLASRPDDEWVRLYRREVPVEVLTAVIDGEVAFAAIAGAAAGRGAVTEAPDGTRWVGLSAVHVVEEGRRRGLAGALCTELLTWAAERSATRAYVQVLADNHAATRLYESMGFSVHHRSRYVDARTL